MPNDIPAAEQRPLREGLTDQSLEPTPIDAWGRARAPEEVGFIAELPSGNVARIRRTLDLDMLLTAGRIPNPLASVVQNMMATGTTSFPKEMGNDPVFLQQLLELLDQTMVRAFISPRVTAPEPRKPDETHEQWLARANEFKPEDGTLSVFKIELQDKLYVYALAQGAAADLARFRKEQEADLGRMADGEDIPMQTGRSGGPNREQRRAAAKSVAASKKPARSPGAKKSTPHKKRA